MNFGFECFKKARCCLRSLYAFGANFADQLGNFAAVKKSRGDFPVLGTVDPLNAKPSDWTYFEAGYGSSYGIDSLGRLWGWGSNLVGAEYNDTPGSGYTYDSPVLVDEPGPWKRVSASPSHALAIKTDGTLWQWGHTVSVAPTQYASLRAKLSAPVVGVHDPSGDLRFRPGRPDHPERFFRKTPTVQISMQNVDATDYYAPPTGAAAGEPGSGATATPNMDFWVFDWNITNSGSKYRSAPKVVVSDGTLSLNTTASMLYKVESITVKEGGEGYTSEPAVTFDVSSYWDAEVVLPEARVSKMGVIAIKVNVTNGGSGYGKTPDVYANGVLCRGMQAVVENGSVTAVFVDCKLKFDEPTVSITFQAANGDGGSGASATCETRNNHVVEIELTNGGDNLRFAPSVRFTGGGGIGAAAEVVMDGRVRDIDFPYYIVGNLASYGNGSYTTPSTLRGFTSPPTTVTFIGECQTAAAASPVISGQVVSVDIISGGNGYTSSKLVKPVAKFIRAAGDADDFGGGSGGKVWYSHCILAPGPVTSISVVSGGAGHSPSATLDVLFERNPDDTKTFDSSGSISGGGARATVAVSSLGVVTSANLVKGGEDYVIEPSASPSGVAIYPRKIGSNTWKEVAAGNNFSAAIGTDGYPYWWGVVPTVVDSAAPLPNPVRVGKRAILQMTYDGNPIPYIGGRYGYDRSVQVSSTNVQPPPGRACAYPGGDTGWGYTGTLPVVTYNFSDYLEPGRWGAYVYLHGPDACSSIAVRGSDIFAVGTDSKLWLLNAFQVALPPEAARGPWQAVLRSGGSGYKSDAKLYLVGQTHKWKIMKRTERWEGYCEPRGYGMGRSQRYTLNEITVHEEGVYNVPDVDYGNSLIQSRRGIAVWNGSVIAPGVTSIEGVVGGFFGIPGVSVPPEERDTASYSCGDGFWDERGTETTERRTYWITSEVLNPGTLVARQDGQDMGAVFDTVTTFETTWGGSGPSQIGLGYTWQKVTKDAIGVLSDGSLRRLPPSGFMNGISFGGSIGGYYPSAGYPLPAHEQQTYSTINDLVGTLPDQSLWIIGNPEFGPRVCHGDIELHLDDGGSGYVEPATVKFNGQPSGVASVNVSLDGKVVSLGVIERGSGYETPPAIQIAGGGGGGASATAVISGEVKSVTVTNAGSGYRLPPIVKFSQPGYSAVAKATLNSSGGVAKIDVEHGGTYRAAPTITFETVPDVESIQVTSGGQNYTSPPKVAIYGGLGGSGAQAECRIDGQVYEVVLTNGGSRYDPSKPPDVVFGPSEFGSTATGTANVNQDGVVTSISITSAGSMYQSPPSVSIVGGKGNGAAAYAKTRGPVDSVTVLKRGKEYYEPPEVFFLGGGGSGATAVAATAKPGSGAAATAKLTAEVIYCQVTSPGSGYTSPPTVTLSGGGQSPTQAVVQARIEGSATASVANGGVGYSQAGTSNEATGPGFYLLGGDHQGLYASHAIPFFGNEQYNNFSPYFNYEHPGTKYGNAVVSTSGSVASVAIPSSIKFSSPPQVSLEDNFAIRARTSMKVAGIGPRHEARVRRYFNEVYTGRFWVTSTVFFQGTMKWIRRPAQGYVYSRAKASYGTPGYTLNYGGQTATLAALSVLVFFRGAKLHVRSQEETNKYTWINNDAPGGFGERILFSEAATVEVEAVIGSGAEITSTLTGGAASYRVTKAGSGYGTLTRVVMRGGKVKVTPATATAVVRDGKVVGIDITDPGSGYYLYTPVVVIHGGGGFGAEAEVTILKDERTAGGILSIRLIACGQGYTSTPTVTIVSMNKRYADAINQTFYQQYKPRYASTIFDGQSVEFVNGVDGRWTGYVESIMSAGGAGVVNEVKDCELEYIELAEEVDDAWVSSPSIPKLVLDSRRGPWTSDDTQSEFELFFTDGYIDSVTLESSLRRSPEDASLRRRLPQGAGVVVSGKCDFPGEVSVVRPKWSSEIAACRVDLFSGATPSQSPWSGGYRFFTQQGRSPIGLAVRDDE